MNRTTRKLSREKRLKFFLAWNTNFCFNVFNLIGWEKVFLSVYEFIWGAFEIRCQAQRLSCCGLFIERVFSWGWWGSDVKGVGRSELEDARGFCSWITWGFHGDLHEKLKVSRQKFTLYDKNEEILRKSKSFLVLNRSAAALLVSQCNRVTSPTPSALPLTLRDNFLQQINWWRLFNEDIISVPAHFVLLRWLAPPTPPENVASRR